MNNIASPDLTVVLTFHSYYQLYHTLAGTLPPPVNDTPEALAARTHAAMDKVAAMLPTNANEAELAAQCVAMRAQADHVLRALRKHEGDIAVEMKLNAQYNAMVRTSSAVLGRLQRTQAIRHKREADGAALKADESTQYVVTRWMQQAMEAGPVPAAPTAERAAPAPAAELPAPGSDPVPIAQPPVPSVAAAPAPELAAAPPPDLAAAPPPAAALTLPPVSVLPPVSAPVAACLPAAIAPGLRATPEPAAGPPRSGPMASPAEADEPPRDLPTEAERYAVVYPRRAQEIRRYGGLPPDCTFGPPDDELMRAIINGSSPALRALDGPNPAAD